MQTLTASEARDQLHQLIDQTAASHQPILITSQQSDAILLSARDWAAIQETLYLLSIPGMRESIHDGMNTPIEQCSRGLDW